MLLILKLVRVFLWFCFGASLGQVYYSYLVQKIPLPYDVGYWICVAISVVLGVGAAWLVRVRCACLLALSLCGGRPGRALLKLLVLTYVLAGPITNMCLNARDVVRVFACSARRAGALARAQHARSARPLGQVLGGLGDVAEEIGDGFRYVTPALRPIESELESETETRRLREFSDAVDRRLGGGLRSDRIEERYRLMPAPDNSSEYLNDYLKKMEYRCEHQLSRGAALCPSLYRGVYMSCLARVPPAQRAACAAVAEPEACRFIGALEEGGLCRSRKHLSPGLRAGWALAAAARRRLAAPQDARVAYRAPLTTDGSEQTPKETGLRVVQAFERKYSIISFVIITIDLVVALLFLRILPAAVAYHDSYLTNIEHDNVYITDLFHKIDEKRRRRNKYALLPLKKMERNRYVSRGLSGCRPADKQRLAAELLKVLLETVTATTFLMLDRLFYEALWVVQRHAAADAAPEWAQDLGVEVTGTGALAALVRALVAAYAAAPPPRATPPPPRAAPPPPRAPPRAACAPAPRAVPQRYYWRVYGGYLLIVLLLCVGSLTVRVNRMICGHFYPERERRRTLHLYNRVLKQRVRLSRTLRRRALRAVRAHYLSGETLLAWRMRFPKMLGWLRILPIARMSCLICGEPEPISVSSASDWRRCGRPRCPFVYCGECWREARGRCLACEPPPARADVDSVTTEDVVAY